MLALFALLLLGLPAHAHNLSYALIKVRIDDARQVSITLNFHLAAYLLRQPQGHLRAGDQERWASLSDAELGQLEAEGAAKLGNSLDLYADGRRIEPASVVFPGLAALRADGLMQSEDARESEPVRVVARLPPGARTFGIAPPADFDESLLVIEDASGAQITQPLGMAQQSHPFLLAGGPDALASRTGGVLDTAVDFAREGFLHILPKGFDHILFVLALVLLAPRVRPLLFQVTAFTLAHSVTLALAVTGLVRAPAGIVEPLIAASIAAVALDNLLEGDTPPRWRIGAVFGFGLLHGLGFASALQGLGLPQGQEATALVAFNLGVEAGQLVVVAIGIAATWWARGAPWYRSRIRVPGSIAIAAFGSYWLVERLMAAFAA